MTETHLYQVEDGWIELVDGTRFYFEAPEDHMIRPEAVAYSLSRLCRYNGHTRRHYSVAEHCVLMADWCEGHGFTPRECLTALHHDDAEYIIGDLPRPVKAKIPQFKELETVLDQAMALRFLTIWPFPGWLKELDARILVDERSNVMYPSDNEWGTDDLDPLGVHFRGLTGRSPWLMRRLWLRRHRRLTGLMMEQEGQRPPNLGLR